jgi:hypothetical protein
MGEPMLVNGPKTIARIRAEGREPLVERSLHDNDNRPSFDIDQNIKLPFRCIGDSPIEVPPYLIKGILPLSGVGLLAGQSRVGKTFVGIDIALSIIYGRGFLDRKVKPGAVLWFAAEGAGEIESRVFAARRERFGDDSNSRIPFFWHEGIKATTTDAICSDIAGMIRAARSACGTTDGVWPNHPLRVVIIDTLAAGLGLADENDNAECAKVMKRLADIGNEAKVLMLIITHFGKAAETGVRGASALTAGADVILACSAAINDTTGAVTGNRSLALTKARRGGTGPLSQFNIASTIIGYDEDRETVTAGYVEFIGGEEQPQGKSKPLSLGLQVVIAAINEALNKHGEDKKIFEDAPPRKVVRIDRVRDEFLRGYVTGDSSTTHASKVKAFSRNLAKVLEGRKYASRTVGEVEYLWVV